MFMSEEEFPLPWEYRQWTFERLVGTPPADVTERTIVFLDCGNIDRMPVDFLQADGLHILNIDHHHDNTRFGTVNLVVPEASCTAEIVWHLAKDLGAGVTPRIADALYTGLVTDTGKFMYENTDAGTHRIAADLIEAGVEVDDTYRRLYEHVPLEKLRLVARALEGIERHCRDRLILTYVTAADYEASGAGEEMTEGIIDHLRSVEGTKVAALARELPDGSRGRRKVSLRATDGSVDVSVIARAGGGGGHRQAAGFATELSEADLVAFLREQVAAQL
jgi:phosphoesterase RecJ-like protein